MFNAFVASRHVDAPRRGADILYVRQTRGLREWLANRLQIFWKERGVSLSKHMVVGACTCIRISGRVAEKKGRGTGVMQERRMASATGSRAASSPSNGRRRNDGPWSETEREKETAGRRFQRPAGANLDAKPWSAADVADTVAATGRPTTRRRRRRRRPRPRRPPMQEYFFCWHRGTVTTGVGRCSSVAKPEGAQPYSTSSPQRGPTHARHVLSAEILDPGYVNSVMFCPGIIMNL